MIKITLILLSWSLLAMGKKSSHEGKHVDALRQEMPSAPLLDAMKSYKPDLLSLDNHGKGGYTYCRATICFKGAHDTTKYDLDYPLCSPGSNVECKVWNMKSMSYQKYPVKQGTLWTGFQLEDVKPRYPVMEGDVIYDVPVAQNVPMGMEWPGCTMDGMYNTKRCSKDVMPYQTQVQVVLVNGEWFAVKDMVFVVKDVGLYDLCWDSNGWQPSCTYSSADAGCKCMSDGLKELMAMVDGVAYHVGGYGSRMVTAGYQKILDSASECSVSHTNGLWILDNIDEDRKGLVAQLKKDFEVHSCSISDKKELCVPESWLKTPGPLQIKVYDSGRILYECSSFIGVVDYCLKKGVWKRFADWHCWTALEWILLFSVLSLIMAFLGFFLFGAFQILRLLGCACHWTFRGTRAIARLGARGAMVGLRRVRDGIEREEIRPVVEQERLNVGDMIMANRRRAGLSYGVFLLMLIGTVSANISDDESCSNIAMSAIKTTCADDECTIMGSIRMTIPSGGTTACFKPDADQVQDTLYKLQILSMEMSCMAEDAYYTSDYDPASCSVYLCPSDCPKAKDAWKKLPNCEHLGQPKTAFMQLGPACAGMGCISCAAACAIWKPYFVHDETSAPVRIFKCSSWVPKLKVNFAAIEAGIVHRTEGVLMPAVPQRLGDFKVVWNSHSISPNLIYTKSFLQDGDRVCYLDASAKGSLERNKVGYVQCPDEASALSTQGCRYDPSQITCHMTEPGNAHCQFPKISWKEVCKNSWLPKDHGGNLILPSSDGPVVSQDNFGAIDVSFSLVKPKRLSAVASKATCSFEDGSVVGCYDCAEGAIITIKSTPEKGHPLVQVTCDEGIQPFTIRCGTERTGVYASKASIDTRCVARWGLKHAEFHLSGTLVKRIDLPTLGLSQGQDRNYNPSWSISLPWGNAMRWIGTTVVTAAIVGLLGWLAWFIIKQVIKYKARRHKMR